MDNRKPDANAPMNRSDSEEWHDEVRQDNRSSRADADEWQAEVRSDLRKHEARMTAIDVKLDANTAATARVEASTQGIVDTMNSWNGAMKTIESIGKTLRPLTWIVTFVAAVVGLWAAIRNSVHEP